MHQSSRDGGCWNCPWSWHRCCSGVCWNCSRAQRPATYCAIELSRATYRKMVQNLLWATVYNLIAIPAAAGMFIRWRLDPPMSVGAIAMNLSTIIVAFNAQLLRRVKLGH